MRLKNILLNVVLPIAVVLGAVMVMRHLVATRPPTPTAPPMKTGQLVTVVEARLHDRPVQIASVGRVKPAREVTLQPEVSGRVREVDPRLVQGGLLPAGAIAVKIDDEAYRLQVAQQQANVAKARVDLQVEGGRKAVAAREWSLLEKEIEASADGRSLALREPYLRLAEVQVAAAGSALERARLDVARTTITVPFNAFVREEAVEPGLLATPQTMLARLVGTDAFWIEVTVALDEVSRIAIPGLAGVAEGQGARVVVRQVGTGEAIVEREGRVIRLLSELDPLGAQARLLVEVPDPLGLATGERKLPLFLGAFVDVAIDAAPFAEVVAVPRKALREGHLVWVLSPEDKLEIREVEVVWRERDEVLVTRGVKPGERIITSPLSAPVAGMPLQIVGATKTAAGADGKAAAGPDGKAAPKGDDQGATP